ncbi:MAG: WG repeat-containing protein [Cyanobacteria bacterium REEB67]|nr:WG repeat-containing protein [Cyanobacteria bacterium REEB67]
MKSKTKQTRTRLVVAWFAAALSVHVGTSPCAAIDRGKWGYIKKDGTFAIKPQFDFAQSFLFQNAYVRLGKAYRVIDENGRLLPKLKTAKPPSPDTDYGVSPVLRDGKWTIYDARHKVTSRKIDFGRAENGLVAARDGSKFGFIDKSFTFILKPRFDEAGEFSEGLARVRTGKLFGYIGPDGKFKIKPQFISARGFHDGLAAVQVACR